ERFCECVGIGERIRVLSESCKTLPMLRMLFKQRPHQDSRVDEGHRSYRRERSTASDNGKSGTAPVHTLSLPRLTTLPLELDSTSSTMRPGPADAWSFCLGPKPAARRKSLERMIRFEGSS